MFNRRVSLAMTLLAALGFGNLPASLRGLLVNQSFVCNKFKEGA